MKKIVKLYKSKNKFLLLSFIFLTLGVYNVLERRPEYYQLLFIISITQFALYFATVLFDRKTKTH